MWQMAGGIGGVGGPGTVLGVFFETSLGSCAGHTDKSSSAVPVSARIWCPM